MSVSNPVGPARGEAWRLGLLFGAIYFLQGIGEPTDGLLAQPARSMLKGWGRSAGEIATFSALLAIPWSIKPLFGFLTDFVPLFGTRRQGYLALAGGATAVSLAGLFAFPVRAGSTSALLAWLLVPAVAMAMADVAADALMIERGQPLGLTGRLQSVQWGCLYAAGIVNGLLGGVLSESRREPWAFLVCALGGLLTMALALACVRDPARTTPRPASREPLEADTQGRPGSIVGICGFLFLWNFNPFSNAVLHVHMTRALGFSERFYGYTVAMTAVAAIVASIGYGAYCTRVPLRALLHASIVLGVVSTLGYAAVVDERSAVVVTLAVGFTYMTATLIQLDLAARACPPRMAGTIFALLMAMENLAASVSTWLGGLLYDREVARWGSHRAFQVLVLAGSACTALCWIVLPMLPLASSPPVGIPRDASSR